MQLKRDTDYAVRILYCLNQNHVAGDSAARKGLALSDIAMQTGTPKVVAGRIVKAVEGNVKIFAVFDKRSEMYKNCEEQLLKIQGKAESLLARTTLESLFDMNTAIK